MLTCCVRDSEARGGWVHEKGPGVYPAECSRARSTTRNHRLPRDANIRKAWNLVQSPSSSSKDDDEEINDAINTTKIIRLEDLYSSVLLFAATVDRTRRTPAYVQKQRATIPKSDANALEDIFCPMSNFFLKKPSANTVSLLF